MDNFLNVSYNTSGTDNGFFVRGTTLFKYALGLIYKTAYSSDIQYQISVGVYSNNNGYYFTYISPELITDIDIRIVFSNVNGDIITLKKITNIDIPFTNGYYNTIFISLNEPTLYTNVFNSLQDLLGAYIIPVPPPDPEPEDDADIIVKVNIERGGELYVNVGGQNEDSGIIEVTIDLSNKDTNIQGGTSTIGGGDGTFDNTSDPIPLPSLPTVSVVNTGLVSLFCPTRAQVLSLGNYLWTHFSDFWENLQKLFTNPMDYFIAFNIFPVIPIVSSEKEIFIGNWGTKITMPLVLSQWYDFNCGNIVIPKYWGNALDYYPNTKIQLMLPFIGSVMLNTDEVMGETLGLVYRIDLLSGACVAMLTVNGSVYYQWTGECAVSIPLTGSDWSRIYSAVMGAVGTAVTGGISAGVLGATAGAATTALSTGKAVSAAGYAGNALANLATATKGMHGAPAMREALNNAIQASAKAAQNAARASGIVSGGIRAARIANTVNNTVGNVMSGKTQISHSGSISGAAGMLGVRDAYILIEFPNQSLAENYKHFVGYPSNMYAKLATLTGYTEVEQVIAKGIWGTDDELAELIDALKGGVYL